MHEMNGDSTSAAIISVRWLLDDVKQGNFRSVTAKRNFSICILTIIQYH